MIEGYFEGGAAAICGATQYDTGQRLRMHGIPPPDEMLAGDALLSGEAVTVMAHYAYEGDEQTDTRLAQWDEEDFCWVAEIPDAYMTRNCPVQVYVYVYWGEDDTGSRGRTMYTGVFTPTYRPAPNTAVSEDMLERWDALEAEADIVLERADTAAQNALSACALAEEAEDTAAESGRKAADAKSAAEDAQEMTEELAQRFGHLSIVTDALSAGCAATAHISGQSVKLGIPRGAKGEKGDAGEDGLSDIALSFANGVLTISPK